MRLTIPDVPGSASWVRFLHGLSSNDDDVFGLPRSGTASLLPVNFSAQPRPPLNTVIDLAT